MLTVATVAFGALLLAVLAALGRPSEPVSAASLLGAAVRGAGVLSRSSDRRRERLRARTHEGRRPAEEDSPVVVVRT